MTTTSKWRRRNGSAEWILFGWVALALASLPIVSSALDGSFPAFTVVWLVGPVVAVVRSGAASVGFRRVPIRSALRVSGASLGAVAILMVIFEPSTHTYRALLDLVFAEVRPDTTFVWLARDGGPGGWLGMAAYSGLVTLFAEELCFRGWLLAALRPRLGDRGAIVAQATAFAIPNLIAAALLPPLQGVLYAVVYAWLGIGVVGGWAAAKTRSIWPSLATATLVNLGLTALVR